ncbi:MAG: hypothetical protein P1V35_02115 [Planctomycetota bacterium]|nr:hypothetical protein [Planctomycetota bacterium]
MPHPPGFVDASADVSIAGGGTVGWPRELGLEAQARGGASSLPLPVIPNDVPILPISGLLGLAGLVLLLFFLRGRSRVLAGVSIGGSVLLFAQIGWTSSQDGGLVRIIEMRGAAPWGVLDSAMDSMEHKPGQRIWLSVKPVASPLVWEVNERGGGWSMVAHSKGALLRKMYSELPGMRTLDAELNAIGNLEQVWVREASGLWTSRGPWALGLELPSTVIEGLGPPSWLVAALPQGPTIWVARFAPGVRPLGGGNPATETWLRVRLDA